MANFKVIPSCSRCKYANYYPISFFSGRFTDPKCSIHMVDVGVDDVCEFFELIGRDCR